MICEKCKKNCYKAGQLCYLVNNYIKENNKVMCYDCLREYV